MVVEDKLKRLILIFSFALGLSILVGKTAYSQHPIATVAINEGIKSTENGEVELQLTVTDPKHKKEIQSVSFSDDGKTYTKPEPFRTKRLWKLTPDQKQIYVKFIAKSNKEFVITSEKRRQV